MGPSGGPDEVPDLDVTAPLGYVGISEGANKGQALVPYAPEIRAATLVAGGNRLGEWVFAWDEVGPDGLGTLFLDRINEGAPNFGPLDYYVALAMLQLGLDPQDPHNHAAFMYDRPLAVGGLLRKPSVLVQEGIGDTRVPNNATRSLAFTLGQVPQLAPIAQQVPFLPTAAGLVTGNIDSETTAGYSQYVPSGVPGLVVTPGCELEPEGHFCAQDAPAAITQRTGFLRSAVDEAVPTIAP